MTRIAIKDRNIVAFYKRIIENEVEDEEYDINNVHVTEVEKMLGIYLSEDAVEELNVFVKTNSTNECASAKKCTKINNMRDFASTNDCTEIESTNDCAGTKCTEINSAKNHGKCKRHWDK